MTTQLAAAGEAVHLAPTIYGVLASLLLSGIIMAQSVEYGRNYTQDPLVLKLTVLSLTMFTIACIICEVIIMKYKFIDSFGDYNAILLSPDANTAFQYFAPLICAISQSFFVHRTFSATKNYFVLAVLGLLTLVTLAVGWAETSVSLITNVSFTKVLMWVQLYSWLSTVTDLAISAVFIFAMMRLRRPVSDYELPSHTIMGKLLVMSLETASLTSTFALINAVFSKLEASGNSKGSYGLILNFTLPNIQVITVLFVLNSRRHLREARDQSSGGGHDATAGRKNFGGGTRNAGQIAVTLQTFTHAEGPPEEEIKMGGAHSAHSEWEEPSPSPNRSVAFAGSGLPR